MIRRFVLVFSLLIGWIVTSAQVSFNQLTSADTVKVRFSHTGGFYKNAFDLKLTVPDQSYNILYTIDGSNPQTSSTAQNGGKSKTLRVDPTNSSGRPQTPCYLVRASLKKDGDSPTFPLTQTYIFIDRVISQSNPGGGWPTDSYVNGQMIDLAMDPDVTKSPAYSSQMNAALTDIPSISIVTDLNNLFSPATGIYVNGLAHGEEWERFCSVELLNPSGEKGFNINAGLRIRGGWSRHGNYPKHGFRLFFRSEYGASKLRFPLFGDEGVNEFDKVDLRCEQNYSWSNGDSRNTCVREVFSRDSQRDLGQPYTRSRYYHLYLDGMYWGLYQTQERSEASYASEYFGGQDDDYDVVKVNVDGYYVEATDGNMDSWQRLYNMCQKGFASNESYFALEGKDAAGYPQKGGEVLVDIDNLIDYLLGIFYTGNFDAPVSAFGGNAMANNFYAIDKHDDKSRGFVFFNHDAEHSMMIDAAPPGIGLDEDRVNLRMSVSGLTSFQPQWFHYKLTENKEYRMRVADRVYNRFFNNGVFTPDVAAARFEKRADEIQMAIIAESARWGDAQHSVPYTKSTWEDQINDVYDRFFPYRTDIVIDQLIEADLYPLFDPPVIRKNGTILYDDVYQVSGDYQLTLNSSKGQIYYTLDGTDPRLIGGEVSRRASQLSNGGAIDLNGTALIKTRVKLSDEWSALREIKFLSPNEDFSNLKVTELNYHPKDSIIGTDTVSGKSFEFIELKNTGSKPINLTGLNFTSSVQYQFKANEVLPPRQFYVIASKSKWFYERYAQVPSDLFDQNFSNSEEQVTVSSAKGDKVVNFTYFDAYPWPTQPDGDGFTLSSVLRYPNGSPADYNYWKSSSVVNGSPFSDDPGIMDSNEDLNLSDAGSVILYPNPTKGALFLKMKGIKTDAEIAIYTLSGSTVFRTTVNDDFFFDLSRFSINPGVYLFRIRQAGRLSIYKVVYQP